MDSVEEWEKLPEAVSYPGMDKMDFGFYRNPMTFYRIRERNLKKLIEKNGLLYKKE